jgi:hypothetical protein
MYTESEAKEKICQETRGSDYGADQLCVGSDCMAWRISYPKQGDGQMVPTGYCGLAGEPKR